jgi:hypothetical protein
MTSVNQVGRILGALMLAHLAVGLIVPYVLLKPLSTAPGGFLEVAATMPGQVRINVLLLLVGGALSVGIAAIAWPVFRQRSPVLGLWLLTLAGVNLALQAVENSHWLSMLSLSQSYAQAGAADPGIHASLGIVVRSAWRWAHYSHILVVVGWLFVLYGALYRSALVPRALAAFGLLTTLLHTAGITLPVFLGYRMPSPELFGMPLGLATLVMAGWLMAKGFEEPSGEPQGRAGETGSRG